MEKSIRELNEIKLERVTKLMADCWLRKVESHYKISVIYNSNLSEFSLYCGVKRSTVVSSTDNTKEFIEKALDWLEGNEQEVF